MPLFTTDIHEARAAYDILEIRANNADLAVASLRNTVDTLTLVHQTLVDNAALQQNFALGQIHTNTQLTVNQAGAVAPDLTLDNFIAALGLSIALAEATMPGRAINSVAATVQCFLTFNPGPNGVPVPGIRLYQPELGAPTALATASFELAKTGGTSGTPAPPSLFAVLQDKQALYSGGFWARFMSGSPPTQPAAQIVAEIAKVFASIGGWSISYLLQEATTISELETALAAATAATQPQPGPAGAVAAYSAAAASLATLITGLNARTDHVAGDLFALSAALDTTTILATPIAS